MRFGISSCPNDTFIFGALYKGLLDVDLDLEFVIEDVETLNRLCIKEKLPASKVSIACLRKLKNYELLDAGGAFSYQGPVVVAKRSMEIGEDLTVAIPGENTTAHLLFSYFHPEVKRKTFVSFDSIMDMVADGRVDAGVLIHEGRFVYSNFGLVLLEDLGEMWVRKTGLPIPLGGIVMHKRYRQLKPLLEDAIRKSLDFAEKNPGKIWDFIERNARHMDQETIRKHIKTYVNSYTYSMGNEGKKAVEVLLGLPKV